MAFRTRKKEKIDPERLREVMHFRGVSIRGMGKDTTGFGWSAKSIERSLDKEEMTPELLTAVSKYLDIDPLYIQGEYHRSVAAIGDSAVSRALKNSLHPDKFPYILAQQREKPDGVFLHTKFIEYLLILHGVSPSQYDSLTPDVQREFDAEVEKAVVPIILKTFDTDAKGKPLFPEIYHLLNDIENY